jgi:hypothetical protein
MSSSLHRGIPTAPRVLTAVVRGPRSDLHAAPLSTALGGPSLFKPAMVTEYASRSEEREAARWRAFRVLTWIVTIGASEAGSCAHTTRLPRGGPLLLPVPIMQSAGGGLVMAFVQEYPGTSRDGDHALLAVSSGDQLGVGLRRPCRSMLRRPPIPRDPTRAAEARNAAAVRVRGHRRVGESTRHCSVCAPHRGAGTGGRGGGGSSKAAAPLNFLCHLPAVAASSEAERRRSRAAMLGTRRWPVADESYP